MTAWENEPGPAPPAPEAPRTRVDVAGDLHDHVIQELFTLGLRIQGDAARSESAVAAQINGYAETLDEVIAKIRTSISAPPGGPGKTWYG
jgi:signal transduction histidine kinase